MPDTKTFSLLDHPECWPDGLQFKNPLWLYHGGLIHCMAALAIIREHMIRTIASVPVDAWLLKDAIRFDDDKQLYEMFTRAKEASK